MIRQYLGAIVTLATLAAPLASQGVAAGEAAFMQQEFVLADSAYREVLAHGTSADRKLAALALAGMDWRVQRDTARAIHDLVPFAGTPPALIMTSRARLGFGNVTGAMSAAQAAMVAARDEEERRTAAGALADAALFTPERSCLDSTPPIAPRDDAAVRDALAQLRAIVAAEPGQLDPAARLIRLAAITGDWASLELGVRSYYVVGRRLPGGPLTLAESELRAMDSAAVPDKAWHAFAALVQAKLFESAALIVTCGPPARQPHDSHTREIIAYAHFLREARRITEVYYGDVARAQADTAQWQSSLVAAGRRLWPQLDWQGSVPSFSQERLTGELDRRFGLVVNVGRTAGTLDLHAGHRISDEARVVRQYGQTATVRFAVLDGMISDGYQSWAWDGIAQHGGWASSDVIIQVREAYANGPLRAWHTTTDSATGARIAQTIARDSAVDVARADSARVWDFPSLAERLIRDARLALLDSLRASGLTGVALQSRFEHSYGDEVDESSIFAHEGRHAIDRGLQLADSTPANLEYRAKLSEVAFAPSPRLALSGIVATGPGDVTPHGVANARLMRGLLDWMGQHAPTLRNRSLPLALEIPLLTDDQLREAVRSLDPLAAAP
ncbi:MAG: hypothetical protein ABIS00_00905 [Gemmatimonadales bacterium]